MSKYFSTASNNVSIYSKIVWKIIKLLLGADNIRFSIKPLAVVWFVLPYFENVLVIEWMTWAVTPINIMFTLCKIL